MKNKVKVLFTSIATIVMTASLAVGATFAIFTSEDTVNISASSGKVIVKASVDDSSVVVSSRDEVMSNGYFANGGQAVWAEDSVALSLITPGDKIEFNINVTNESDVKALYRTIVKCEDGLDLFAGLRITIDYGADAKEEQVFDGITAYGAWTLMDAVTTETVVETVKVVIEFPYLETSQNEYQGLSTSISFSVEAVQSNATVVDNSAHDGEVLVYSLNDLRLVETKASKGYTFQNETIKLCNDIDLGATASMRSVEKNWKPFANFAGTFDGQGYTISNLVSIEENNAGLIGNLSGGTIKNVTIKNAYVSATSYAGAIVGLGYTGAIENCHVEGLVQVSGNYMVGGINGHGYATISNCSVIGESGSYVQGIFAKTDLEGDNVGGIVGHMAESNTVADCIVKGVTVAGTRKVGGIVGIANGGSAIQNAIVENVVVKTNADDTYLAENESKIFVGGILGEYNGNVTVSGSIKNANVQGLEEKTGASGGGSRQADAVLTSSVKIGDQTQINSGVYAYNADKAMLFTEGEDVVLLDVKEYTGDKETFVVPEGVTIINASNMASLNPKKVVFADSVVSVGRVFDSCAELTEVVLNEGLEVIGNRAFRRCYALTEITLPSTLTTIESAAFQSCTALEEINLPANLIEIGEGAFAECSLKSLVIPEGVTTIAKDAFRANEFTEVTIPASVTSIGQFAFRDCYDLVTVHVKCATVPTVAANAFTRMSGTIKPRNYYIYNNDVYAVWSDSDYNKIIDGQPKYATYINLAPVNKDATSAEEFKGALGDGSQNIVIDATELDTTVGNMITSTTGNHSNVDIYGGTTIKGATIETTGANQNLFIQEGNLSSEIVFEGCTFKTADFTRKTYLQVDVDDTVKVVFNNCIFEGQIVVSGWTVDGKECEFEFNNCEFKLGAGTGYVQCGGGNVYFNNCSFDYAGGSTMFDSPYTKYNKINLYSDRTNVNVTFTNCVGVSVFQKTVHQGYTNTYKFN